MAWLIDMQYTELLQIQTAIKTICIIQVLVSLVLFQFQLWKA